MSGKPPSGTIGQYLPTKIVKEKKPAAPKQPSSDAKTAHANTKTAAPVQHTTAAASGPVASGWADEDNGWDPFGGGPPTATAAPANNKPAAGGGAGTGSGSGSGSGGAPKTAVSGEITSLFNQLQWAPDSNRPAHTTKSASAGPPPPGKGGLSPVLGAADAPAPPSPVASPKRANANAASSVVSPASGNSSHQSPTDSDAWAAFDDSASEALPSVPSTVDWNAFAEEARTASIAGGRGAGGKPKLKESKQHHLTVSTAKPTVPTLALSSAGVGATPMNTPQPVGTSPRTPASAGVSANANTSLFTIPSHLSSLHEHHNSSSTPKDNHTPNPNALLRGVSQPAGTSSGGGGGPSRPASTPPVGGHTPHHHHTGSGGGGSGNSTPASAKSGSGTGTMDFGNLLGRPEKSDSSPAVGARQLTMAEQIAAKRHEAEIAHALSGFGGGSNAGPPPPSNVSAHSHTATPPQPTHHIFTVTAASGPSQLARGRSDGGGGGGGGAKASSGDAAFAFVNTEKNSLLKQ